MNRLSTNIVKLAICEFMVAEQTIEVQSCELIGALVDRLFLHPRELCLWVNTLEKFFNMLHWEWRYLLDSDNLNARLWTVFIKALFNIESNFTRAEDNLLYFVFSKLSGKNRPERSSICKLFNF